MFAYGLLSMVLVLYLTSLGFGEGHIGLLISLSLIGDLFISLWITTIADRIGRKQMLILGAILMLLAGLVFAISTNYVVLIIAATLGVLSPSDKEVGPFLSIEQAALSQAVPDEQRTRVFAWYNLVGSITAAVGALMAGVVCQQMLSSGYSETEAYRPIVLAYAVVGGVLLILFALLGDSIDPPPNAGEVKPLLLGLHESRGIVLKLSALFAVDAFGGGFILQSFVAYWFRERFDMHLTSLGSLFFVANLLAAMSSLLAASLAKRFGLINTMVFTHLPSNILLILIPLMPNAWWASAILLFRFSISQMDVPTRQSYTMSVVHPDERSAAAGITTVARSLGGAISPVLTGLLLASPGLLSVPFFLAGGTKIIYDLWLYRAFTTSQEKSK